MGLVEPVRERAAAGMPIFGTCAGMIVLARRVEGGEPLFDLIDITVRRNAYGRQVDSFEADLDVEGIDHPVRGVFIRAPRVEDLGPEVRVLATHEGHPVVLEHGNLLVASFHPGAGPRDRAPRLLPEEGVAHMSGHSKWATIKRKKEATDSKRSSMYAKLLRAVEVAAREGGGNVDGNMTLASAVEKAKSFSVPNDNIERAIKRGTGELSDGARYEELQYEGYAPGGVALLVQALTDNRNRTGQEIRHAFTKHNGNLGEQGSTAWMFARKGVIEVEKDSPPTRTASSSWRWRRGAEDLNDSESSGRSSPTPSRSRP